VINNSSYVSKEHKLKIALHVGYVYSIGDALLLFAKQSIQ